MVFDVRNSDTALVAPNVYRWMDANAKAFLQCGLYSREAIIVTMGKRRFQKHRATVGRGNLKLANHDIAQLRHTGNDN